MRAGAHLRAPLLRSAPLRTIHPAGALTSATEGLAVQFNVYMVCGHCESSELLRESVDVLICTLALMQWPCPACARLRAFVVKPASDADAN